MEVSLIPNRPLFIVTSALRPSIGVFSDKERFDQTMQTLISIRKKCPNAYIVFADASVREVPAMEFLAISKSVNYFMKMHEKYNEDVITLSQVGRKSEAETALLYHIMVKLKVDPNLQQAMSSVSRVFKITGRLELDEGFDFKEYGKGQLNNIYQDTQHYGPRDSDVTHEGWLTQFRICIKQRPYCQFTVVHDNPPEPLHHLQTGIDLKNTKLMTYAEFTEKVLGR